MSHLKALSFALAASMIALAGLASGSASAFTFTPPDLIIAQAGGTVTPPGGSATSGATGGAGAGAGARGSMRIAQCAQITDLTERRRCMDRAPSGTSGSSGSMGIGGTGE